MGDDVVGAQDIVISGVLDEIAGVGAETCRPLGTAPARSAAASISGLDTADGGVWAVASMPMVPQHSKHSEPESN